MLSVRATIKINKYVKESASSLGQCVKERPWLLLGATLFISLQI